MFHQRQRERKLDVFFSAKKAQDARREVVRAKLRFHMGIPVWKWGLVFLNARMETGIPHLHMGMCQFPFPYGDPRMEKFLEAKIFGDAMMPGA
jgi:hypothetical protein